MSSQDTPELQPLLDALNGMPLAIALYNSRNALQWSNTAFGQWRLDSHEEFISLLQARRDGAYQLATDRGLCQLCGYRVGDSYCVTAHPYSAHQGAREKLLQGLLDAFKEGQSLFQAVAEAIARALSWRWVGVSRITDDRGNVDILGWWSGDRNGQPFSMNIFKTPCEVVMSTGQFAFFRDVARQFPEDHLLTEMGATSYAGLIYRDRQHQAVGHILALHDSNDVDETLAEDLLRLASIVLGSQFELLKADAAVEKAEQESHTDSLTNLGNRRAFTRDLNMELTLHRMGSVPDGLLAIIDLDGMKTVNDTLGHEAGDRMLVMVAGALSAFGRDRDNTYRLGGDEFALLLSDARRDHEPALRQRLADIMAGIRQRGFEIIDASVGFAQLSEGDNDLEQLFQIADLRMYDDKKRKRQARR